MASALIIGGDATIGKALAAHLEAQGTSVHTTSRKPDASLSLDLAQEPARWPALPKTDVAFLCAAVTSLDTCEKDPATTARVNVIHMQALASQLFAQGTYVIFLSSNQVFDGTKPYRKATEATCPVSQYGIQKALFENWLLAQSHAACVLRLTKVIAGKLPIVTTWEHTLKASNPVEAFGDLVFAPLPLKNAVMALTQLALDKPYGIYQLSGTRDISYYDVALHLAQKHGASAHKTSALSAGVRQEFLPAHTTLAPSDCFAAIHCPDPMHIVGFKP